MKNLPWLPYYPLHLFLLSTSLSRFTVVYGYPTFYSFSYSQSTGNVSPRFHSRNRNGLQNYVDSSRDRGCLDCHLSIPPLPQEIANEFAYWFSSGSTQLFFSFHHFTVPPTCSDFITKESLCRLLQFHKPLLDF